MPYALLARIGEFLWLRQAERQLAEVLPGHQWRTRAEVQEAVCESPERRQLALSEIEVYGR